MIRFILEFFGAFWAFLPLYLLIRRPWRFRDKRELVLGIFVLYVLALLFLTFRGGVWGTPVQLLHRGMERLRTMDRVNLHPFFTVRLFWNWGNIQEIWINLFGNVLMFIPYGFGLPLLWKKARSPLAVLLLPLLLTVFIETVQLFINRQPDVDDVMLNWLGGMIGEGIFLLTRFILPKLDNFAR